ncbi:hypothetical protein ACQKM1_22300 [Peribacillus frigoritolerans]|uniref:hypothetical protein n=1 Tax=Peribacillus frigoritolerans TaxID=450367 RepID=UPI003D001DCD
MAQGDIKVPFGLADITVTTGSGEVVKFDGKENLQVEGGEVSLSPSFSDIQFADFGESVYDRYITGYEGTVSFSAGQESIKVLQAAMSYLETITDTANPETAVGLMDAKIGTSMRSKAGKVTIHPRVMGDDKSYDINIYKMAATGEFTRSYGNEQGNIPIEYSMFPRDGFDVSKPGNFFYIGPKDPNSLT